jgi:hypothetical protein
MSGFDRRRFLGASLATCGAAWAWPSAVRSEEEKKQAAATATAAGDIIGPPTLFLTWHQDPTTSMVVQWIGPDAPSSDTIAYATVDTPLWQTARPILKPFPNTDLKVYRCELTGLKPATEYQFTIGKDARALRFRTMPQKATDTFQWVSGGDAGVDVHAVNTNRIAAKQEPYFALIAGDLAYDNGRSPKTFIKYLENYRSTMIDKHGRLIPMVSCIGNHEVDGGYQGTRERSPQYLSVFDGLFKDTTYGVLDIGDFFSLVLLDTDHIAPIEGEQTNWLEATLRERQDRSHLIVANHVPAYPSYRSDQGSKEKTGTGEMNRKHWCPLFEKYNVDVVLEHHDHTFKRTHPLKNGLVDKHGVLYLGDGSWGKLRAPKTPAERPYLAAVSQSYHMTVHRMEGEQRFHVALDEDGKLADVCMTSGKRPQRRV